MAADVRKLEATAANSNPPPPFIALKRRLHILRWAVPAGLLGLVALYEVFLSRWVRDALSEGWHLAAEIFFYGLVGPVLAFLVLDLLSRWLEERETSDFQAQVLAQARENVRLSQSLHDDSLQVLYAADLLLSLLEPNLNRLPPEVAAQIDKVRPAMAQAIEKLRARLTSD